MKHNFKLPALEDIDVHFIIGPGRSGTTLLINILKEHENCITNPEIMHFLYFYKKYRNIKEVTPKLRKDLENYIQTICASKPQWFAEQINFDLLDLLEVKTQITYAQIAKLMYLVFSSKGKDLSKIKVIVDKTPFYTFQVDKILTVFPNARFVPLVRDPRGYVLSNRQSQVSFLGNLSIYFHAFVWKRYAYVIDVLCQSKPHHFLLVKYENWVLNTDEYLKSMIAFFGLSYTNELKDFYKKKKALIATLTEEQKEQLGERKLYKLERLSQPINPDRLHVWKDKFTKVEIEKINFALGQARSTFGYKDSPYSVSIRKSLQYYLQSLPNKCFVSMLYTCYTPKLRHFVHVGLRIKNKKQKSRIIKNN